MSKKIAKKEETTAVDVSEYAPELDTGAEIDARDLILPKILLMQGLSKQVADGKGRMGEIRGSLEENLLAEIGEGVAFIPFHFDKTWIIYEKEKGKKESYKQTLPWRAENADWGWSDVVDGVEIRRVQSLNFYCVLPHEIESGMFLPYVISFRSTGYKAGKNLITHAQKLKMFGRPLASKVFTLKGLKTENELGTFYVPEVTVLRDSTQEEQDAVKPWCKLVAEKKVRVDESDVETEEVRTAAENPDLSDVAY